jgi:hypothetical protein
LAKARTVKDHLSLHSLELILDDVLNLSPEKHGYFDVVLCLGILYHLDHPDVMNFVQKIAAVCGRVAIIDTHFSLRGADSYAWNGHTYWGTRNTEHHSTATSSEKAAKLWQSLDNVKSFSLTRASLSNLLRRVGFTSVYECLNPYEYRNPNWPGPPIGDSHVIWENRSTFVAVKGSKQTILSNPATNLAPEVDRPERPEYFGGWSNPWMHQNLAGRIVKLLPRPARQMLRAGRNVFRRSRQ